MKSTDVRPLTKERKQTDDSLTDERGKADESFDTYREKTETETDKVVLANRLEADKARKQRRSEADSVIESDADDLRLKNERNLEDNAIRKERTKNDLALEIERDETERLLNELVGQERKATDKNLSSERAKTDSETESAVQRLTNEKAAHLTTKSALTTREEFVTIVSHDLRNPIGTILSCAEILSKDVSMQAIGADAKRWVDMIKRNAEISLRLIKDILDMERIVEGKLQLDLGPCGLKPLLHEVVESFSHVAAAKKISLGAEIGEFECPFHCDSERVRQILSNLIANALKFTPSGGSIHVTASEIENAIKVSVRDTGPGIPQQKQDHIFKRFTQIGNKDRSGLGLGLYITKTLVDSHKGELWVESTEGKGSEFSFTLPVA